MSQIIFFDWVNALKCKAEEAYTRGGIEAFKKTLIQNAKCSSSLNYYLDHGPNSYRMGVAIGCCDNTVNLILGRRGEDKLIVLKEGKEVFTPIPKSMWSLNFNRSSL